LVSEAKAKGPGVLRDSRGAMMVEFTVAILPVLTLWACLWQLSVLYSADLITRHAATVAARAAIVVLPGDPARYDDEPMGYAEPGSKRVQTIKRAAASVLRASPSIEGFTVRITDGAGNEVTSVAPEAVVGVEVRALFRCFMPLAQYIVCRNGVRELGTEASMVNQGAEYEFDAPQEVETADGPSLGQVLGKMGGGS
jgi:hypothetical protein